MNERIQELAYQAEDYADSIVDQGGEFHPAYTQKLAELIVRECCQFEKTYGGDAGLVARSFSRKIREHFGVEE